MFIDYITLLLANMAGGLFVLALYLVFGAGRDDRRAWSPAFFMPGLVAFVVGLHMTLTWPIPKLEHVDLRWANIAYGEMSVMLGVLFLGGALALAKGWSMAPIGAYALVASLAGALIGVRIFSLGFTTSPAVTTIGFALTAGGGVLTALALTKLAGMFSRVMAALFLLSAAGVWAFIAGMAYWAHIGKFGGA